MRLMIFLLWPMWAVAQWSDDPANNQVIAGGNDEQVQAKIVPTADGGAYISWYDNATGGYDVYLQKIDAAGTIQWLPNGILVADRGYSSTQDYGLATDSAGNALLTFRDDRGGTEKITANKISPNGALLWGTSGIAVSGTTGFLANPKIAGTTDGGVAVAWTQDTTVVINKFDDQGVALWPNPVTLTAAGSALLSSDLQASDQGHVIVSMVESASFPSPKYLWAQKLAASDGAPLWGNEPLRVFDAANGSLQFGNFPAFISDGMGGAVFSWYTTGPSLTCLVQRVDAAGTEYFAHNGVATSTNANQLRVAPTSVFDPVSESIYTAWVELSLSQSQSGIYAQKFDLNGVRQWTDAGKSLVALDNSSRSFVQAALINDRLMVSWINSFSFDNDIVEGTQVDANGDFTWLPAVVDVGSDTAGDSRLAGAASINGFGMYVWTENTDLKAQNLNPDGTLGPFVIFKDGFDSNQGTSIDP